MTPVDVQEKEVVVQVPLVLPPFWAHTASIAEQRPLPPAHVQVLPPPAVPPPPVPPPPPVIPPPPLITEPETYMACLHAVKQSDVSISPVDMQLKEMGVQVSLLPPFWAHTACIAEQRPLLPVHEQVLPPLVIPPPPVPPPPTTLQHPVENIVQTQHEYVIPFWVRVEYNEDPPHAMLQELES